MTLPTGYFGVCRCASEGAFRCCELCGLGSSWSLVSGSQHCLEQCLRFSQCRGPRIVVAIVRECPTRLAPGATERKSRTRRVKLAIDFLGRKNLHPEHFILSSPASTPGIMNGNVTLAEDLPALSFKKGAWICCRAVSWQFKLRAAGLPARLVGRKWKAAQMGDVHDEQTNQPGIHNQVNPTCAKRWRFPPAYFFRFCFSSSSVAS